MSQNEELKNKISRYYDNDFDPTILIELLNGHDFKFREFGYQSFEIDPAKNDFGFHRNLNFNSPFHLMDWSSKIKPRKLYLGAQYNSRINRSIENTEWNSTDLKFDIDLDCSEEIRRRICRCNGKDMCNDCFEVAKEATSYLIEVLDKDFACERFPCYKNNAIILLSGSKGTHIHYPKIDKISLNQNDQSEEELRRFIIDYIQMVSEPKKRKPTDPPIKILHQYFASASLEKHFYELIVKWFFEKISIDQLKAMDWNSPKETKKKGKTFTHKGAKIKPNELARILTEIKDEISHGAVLNKEKITEYGIYYPILFENILKNRYPRYDGPITFDTRRIIKVPNSVDGSTGRIVQKISYNRLWDVNLSDLLTVDHFV